MIKQPIGDNGLYIEYNSTQIWVCYRHIYLGFYYVSDDKPSSIDVNPHELKRKVMDGIEDKYF